MPSVRTVLLDDNSRLEEFDTKFMFYNSVALVIKVELFAELFDP